MPEENDSDPENSIEEEMLRMMEQELGDQDQEEGDAQPQAEAGTGDALEAEMLRAMQEEAGQQGDAQPQAEAGTDDALEAEMLQTMMQETSADTPDTAQIALQRTQSMLPGAALSSSNIPRLMSVELSVSIELGRTRVPISTLLEWSEGSLIELDKVSGEAVDVMINGKPFARGEVITIAENFGVRIVDVMPAIPRG